MPPPTDAVSTVSPPSPVVDDTQTLVVKAKQGDRKAMEWLIRTQQRKIYATLAQLLPERQDVSDLTQDALIRMVRGLPNLQTPATFKVWLNRIVMNLFYDEMRKLPRQLPTVALEMTDADSDASDGQSQTRDIADHRDMPHQSTERKEMMGELMQALEKLEEPFRSAIVLKEVQGLSYDDIAEVMDTTLGTVKSRIARARMKLQASMSSYLSP
jgi:RNA polymerase sigma-70 factor (ECF subfamily)